MPHRLCSTTDFIPSRFVAVWLACIRQHRHLVAAPSVGFVLSLFSLATEQLLIPRLHPAGPPSLAVASEMCFCFFRQCQSPASQNHGCVPLLRLFLLCYCFCMVRLRSALATLYRALATICLHVSPVRSLASRTSHNGPLRHRALATMVPLCGTAH